VFDNSNCQRFGSEAFFHKAKVLARIEVPLSLHRSFLFLLAASSEESLQLQVARSNLQMGQGAGGPSCFLQSED